MELESQVPEKDALSLLFIKVHGGQYLVMDEFIERRAGHLVRNEGCQLASGCLQHLVTHKQIECHYEDQSAAATARTSHNGNLNGTITLTAPERRHINTLEGDKDIVEGTKAGDWGEGH